MPKTLYRPALRTFAFASAVAASVAAVPVAASDAGWPQYRGPDRAGAVAASGAFPDGGFALALAWKRPLGSGYSGIVTAGGPDVTRGVTMFTDGESDLLAAFALADGKELWRYRIAPMYEGHSGGDDGPSSTPAIADGTVYALGPKGDLVAVRLDDGAEVWRRTLGGEGEATEPYYGHSTAPLVVGELVIVETGGPEGRVVTAYARDDGTVRWTRGYGTVQYHSPSLLELDGSRQLVAVTERDVIALVPESGELLWRHEHRTVADEEGFAMPLLVGPKRLMLNALDGTVVLEVKRVELKAGGGGTGGKSGWAVYEVWRSNVLQRTYALPVYRDGYVYGLSGAILVCVDAATGKVAWRSRQPGGKGLILVDGQLVMLGADGHVVTAAASPDGYRETARVAALAGDSYTAPSFAAGRILVRDLDELAAVTITSSPRQGAVGGEGTAADQE